jgi:LL-diaminopimelate aminotransferase
MEIKPAQRISQVKPYFFADLEKTIAHLAQSGMDIVRLDMGSPDLPPEEFIIESLIENARLPDMHGYGKPGGTFELRSAFAQYYQNRFNVELDPDREVLGLIGSKEGIFNLSQVLINADDLVLLPDPCYPVYRAGAVISRGETYPMPLLSENNFLPDLDQIPEDVARHAKLMWLNYPNNPTGAVAPLSFFEEVIDFARKFEIVVAHDAPYVDVCFDQYIAPSILQVAGSKEVAVEFNSLSKTYNMAGWRVGVAAGNAEIIRLLRLYKSQLDSSHFTPIMEAAKTALLGDQSWVQNRNLVYQSRRDIVVKTMKELGFSIEMPKASLYVWAGLPEGWNDGIVFCDALLRQTGVSITPGVVYGNSGAGYVRISLVTPEVRLMEAMRRMNEWMKEKD